MENVLLVIHLLACLALIGVVLLQRSEGGALGIGGGGGGGLMSGRGAANALTRATMVFATVFLVTSLTLSAIYSRQGGEDLETEFGPEIVDPTASDLLDSPIDLDGLGAPADDLGVPADDLGVPADTPTDDDAAPSGDETPRSPQ